MKLFLIRHAEAEAQTPGMDDAERMITENGKKETKALAKLLQRLGEKPDAIVVSPLTRALQTAAIIRKCVHFKREIMVFDGLMPDAKTDDLVNYLSCNKDFEKAYVIGHQPFLGHVVSRLTGYSKTFEVSKSSVVIINLTFTEAAMSAEIKGYLTPSIIKKLV